MPLTNGHDSDPPGLLPIIGLSGLTAAPGRQALIVEGVDAQIALAATLANLAVITWVGLPHETDWTPLAGRNVVIWPRADLDGLSVAHEVAAHVFAVGAIVKAIRVQPGMAEGWDAYAALKNDHWSAKRILEYARSNSYVMSAEALNAALEIDERREVVEDAYRGVTDMATPAMGTAAPSLVTTESTAPLPAQPVQKPKRAAATRGNVTAIHGAPLPETREIEGWRQNVIKTEDGKPLPKLSVNWRWYLAGHHDTRGLFAWNDVAQCEFLLRAPPWADGDGWHPRAMTESDIIETRGWLERHGMRPQKNDARDTIKLVAREHSYNPVLKYLEALKWDGCPRLAGGPWEGDTVEPLSVEYLGAPGDQIFATFVRKFHIGAVARVMRPGCKVDTMLILESDQGKLKSSYIRKMATIQGHEYFGDSIGDIVHKESIMLLQGTWLVEISELAGFDRKEINHIKAWLSRTTDRMIPKYEGVPREMPRRFVVAGTHNPTGHGYLKDPTGARRFWPVPVGRIELARVERDRDQIWAEAVHRYRAGEHWYLTADEEAEADALTVERRAEDPWSARINTICETQSTTTLQQIMSGLNIPSAQQNELTVKRISEHLRAAGWSREKRGEERIWVRAPVEGTQAELLG